MRKFERVNETFVKYNEKETKMPVRATKYSVAYDFYSPINIVIEPNKTEMIWTNVKATFGQTEALILAVTSGMGKKSISLPHGIGVIESDYYNNESNNGNLGFMLHNFGTEPYIVNKGDKIGQGFFINFLTVDNEIPPTTVRKGGFGSTNTIK